MTKVHELNHGPLGKETLLYGQFGLWLASPHGDQVAGPDYDRDGAFPLDAECAIRGAILGDGFSNEESKRLFGQAASPSANQEPSQLFDVEQGTSWIKSL